MKEIKKFLIAESSKDEAEINRLFATKTVSSISFSTSECEVRFTDGTKFSINCDGMDALEMWIPRLK